MRRQQEIDPGTHQPACRRGGRPTAPGKIQAIAMSDDRQRFSSPPPAEPAGAPAIFDRRRLRIRLARAASGPECGNFLVDRAAADMADRLAAVQRTFEAAVVLDAGGGFAADLQASGKARWLARGGLAATPGELPVFVADEEHLPLGPQTVDLVASLFTLHFVNDLPGALVQVRHALKPDGLFVAAMLGGETLIELRTALIAAEAEAAGGAAPRVAPFVDVRTAGDLLMRAGFALPVADSDRLTARYENLPALFEDLAALGLRNVPAGPPVPLRRSTIARADALYREMFAAPDGRLPATFEIVHVAGWAPHPSQQKPLRPGSAAARLADALGVDEHRLKR